MSSPLGLDMSVFTVWKPIASASAVGIHRAASVLRFRHGALGGRPAQQRGQVALGR